MVHIERVWAMPNKYTFQIGPIKRLLRRYVGSGKGWIDPFSGDSSLAEITNDINPNLPATFHIHATDFSKQLSGKYNGVLYDAPYSPRQIKECYDSMGLDMDFADTQGFPNNIKDILAPKIQQGGYAICCGWNSSGFGINRGFELIEVLLVCHGGQHNDTIVTVERKLKFKPLVDVYNQV